MYFWVWIFAALCPMKASFLLKNEWPYYVKFNVEIQGITLPLDLLHIL